MMIVWKHTEREVESYGDLVYSELTEQLAYRVGNLLEALVRKGVLTEQDVLEITWRTIECEVRPKAFPPSTEPA